MSEEADQSTLEEIVNNIEESAPVARDAPLPAMSGETQTSGETVNNSQTVETDSDGEPWDPEIHTAGRTKTAAGKWRRKPTGRPRKDAGAPSPQAKSVVGGKPLGGTSPAPEGEGAPATAPGLTLAECRAVAQQAVGAAVGVHAMAFGEDWLVSQPEAEGLINATAAYFMATGQMVNLPPWVGLAGAYLGYAAPRFQKPNTKKRIATYFGKVRKIWEKVRPRPKPPIVAKEPEKMAANPDGAKRPNASVGGIAAAAL